MEHIFQVFGSENSTDYDIMVFVNDIPKNIDEGHSMCKKFNNNLLAIFLEKTLNTNFGVLKDGVLIYVFKGTTEEANNSLFFTYDLHIQYHLNSILYALPRDLFIKKHRATRCIISFFSRSYLRKEIKIALRGSLSQKIDALKLIDFNIIREFPHKKESVLDIYKVIAFQFGQLFSLMDGHETESYTKNGIIKNYPKLEPMLNRCELSEDDYYILNVYKQRLTDMLILSQKPMHN